MFADGNPQEFILNANANQGSANPYGIIPSGSNTVLSGMRSHDADLVYNRLAIAGLFKFCALSAHRTTADDSNMYDTCRVRSLGNGQWEIESIHDEENAIQCRAMCIN